MSAHVGVASSAIFDRMQCARVQGDDVRAKSAVTRVVLVEDDDDVRRLLEFNLTSAGFDVIGLADGAQAIETALREEAMLLVLDRMLPDGDGLTVCQQVRHDPRLDHVGVLLLTALGGENDRIEGLASGADDYVVKPFSVREVIARVRILASAVEARRIARRVNLSEAWVYRWRDLSVDVRGHRVLAAGAEIELRPFEFVLLRTFLENPDHVWSRDELIAKLWDGEVLTSRRTIDVHVRRLRERLGPYGDVVETIHGVGYRLRPES